MAYIKGRISNDLPTDLYQCIFLENFTESIAHCDETPRRSSLAGSICQTCYDISTGKYVVSGGGNNRSIYKSRVGRVRSVT